MELKTKVIQVKVRFSPDDWTEYWLESAEKTYRSILEEAGFVCKGVEFTAKVSSSSNRGTTLLVDCIMSKSYLLAQYGGDITDINPELIFEDFNLNLKRGVEVSF